MTQLKLPIDTNYLENPLSLHNIHRENLTKKMPVIGTKFELKKHLPNDFFDKTNLIISKDKDQKPTEYMKDYSFMDSNAVLLFAPFEIRNIKRINDYYTVEHFISGNAKAHTTITASTFTKTYLQKLLPNNSPENLGLKKSGDVFYKHPTQADNFIYYHIIREYYLKTLTGEEYLKLDLQEFAKKLYPQYKKTQNLRKCVNRIKSALLVLSNPQIITVIESSAGQISINRTFIDKLLITEEGITKSKKTTAHIVINKSLIDEIEFASTILPHNQFSKMLEMDPRSYLLFQFLISKHLRKPINGVFTSEIKISPEYLTFLKKSWMQYSQRQQMKGAYTLLIKQFEILQNIGMIKILSYPSKSSGNNDLIIKLNNYSTTTAMLNHKAFQMKSPKDVELIHNKRVNITKKYNENHNLHQSTKLNY